MHFLFLFPPFFSIPFSPKTHFGRKRERKEEGKHTDTITDIHKNSQ